MTVHTAQCLKMQAELEAWMKLWPKSCTTCGCYGSISYQATRDDPGGSEPCSNCIEYGICPRCGDDSNLTYTEHGGCDYPKCLACGWDEWIITANLEGQKTMVSPWDGECDCWMEEELAEQKKAEVKNIWWEQVEETEMENLYDADPEIVEKLLSDEVSK